MQTSATPASPTPQSNRSLPFLPVAFGALACVACLALTALGWQALSGSAAFQSYQEGARFAASEQSNTDRLSRLLAEGYLSEEVNARVTWGLTTDAQDPRYRLDVTFVNPSFQIPDGNSQRIALAQAIASEVADSYPDIDRFEFITITFAKARGTAINLTTWLTFAFSVDDLVCPSAPEQWVTTFTDDFASNVNDWPTGADSDEFVDSDLGIARGAMTLSVTAHQDAYVYRYPGTARLTDFYLQARVRQVSGPSDDFYGITFRVSDWKHYFFGISDSQDFVIRKRHDQYGWADTLILAPSTAIEPGRPNTLTLMAQEGQFTACINHRLVARVEDLDYKEGVFGLGLLLNNEGDHALLEYTSLDVLSPKP